MLITFKPSCCVLITQRFSSSSFSNSFSSLIDFFSNFLGFEPCALSFAWMCGIVPFFAVVY